MKINYLTLLVFAVSLTSFGQSKYSLDDFAISLEQVTSAPNHIWVNSGYTTVNPDVNSVTGVNGFFSPPLVANNFKMKADISVDSQVIEDKGSTGKGDVGLLYTGGVLYPHKVTRKGTYNHLKNGKHVSIGVYSELIPLFGKSGFVNKITVVNRTKRALKIKIEPKVNFGNPSLLALEKWNFGVPASRMSDSEKSNDNIWVNEQTKIKLFEQDTEKLVEAGKTITSYFTVILTDKDMEIPMSVNPEELERITEDTWGNRLEKFTKNIPLIESDLEGLDDYYKRSIISGLVCIWENPAFTLNPYVATSGMDGGGTNAYLWDLAGYTPQMLSLMMGETVLDIAKKMAEIDLTEYYSYSLAGTGIGVRYAYSPWAFTSLVSNVFKMQGPNTNLFNELKRILLDNEKLKKENYLIDYGTQHNLLEMRGAGWEHFVASPNAERSWCLLQLAEMAKKIGYKNTSEIEEWEQRAEKIKNAVQKELWNEEAGWFNSIYPDGHKEVVYSIQAYDAMRAGVCTPEMEKSLIAHLRDGAFLGLCGVTSVSKEDDIHFEVLDSDWSGGGAYTGDGSQLALTIYETGHPEIGMDILKRLFWMGKHLIYYPQEIYFERPVSPSHKRANVVSGLGGAQAVLFGLIGFTPDYDGGLEIRPNPVKDGKISIKGFSFRGNTFDIELSKQILKVHKNGIFFYEGKPKRIRLL